MKSSLDNPGLIGFNIDIVISLLGFFFPFFGYIYPELIATGWQSIFI